MADTIAVRLLLGMIAWADEAATRVEGLMGRFKTLSASNGIPEELEKDLELGKSGGVFYRSRLTGNKIYLSPRNADLCLGGTYIHSAISCAGLVGTDDFLG